MSVASCQFDATLTKISASCAPDCHHTDQDATKRRRNGAKREEVHTHRQDGHVNTEKPACSHHPHLLQERLSLCLGLCDKVLQQGRLLRIQDLGGKQVLGVHGRGQYGAHVQSCHVLGDTCGVQTNKHVRTNNEPQPKETPNHTKTSMPSRKETIIIFIEDIGLTIQ
jgi:hypothetical protein